MDPREVVRTKRDGGALAPEQIDAFLGDYVAGRATDAQAAALLASIFAHGMQPDELVHWTRGMLESGERLELAGIGRPVADKHSTGGVGDKVSLPLAPAVAACGVAVPMISGRGLGHTGGTLDKLEAIPGMRTELSLKRIREVVGGVGAVIAAQTAELVPADRKLYALRDATGLVECAPLIASSILSKKLAEDLGCLVLDVKFGSGAFLGDPEEGESLARTMLKVARRFDLAASVVMTSMEQPVGRAVGHALEVREAIECLRGAGPPELRELVLVLGAEMLVGAGVAEGVDAARARIADALDGGGAQDVFAAMVAAQGGDPGVVDEPDLLPRGTGISLWCAPASGVLDVVDCRRIGLAATALGGGRVRPDDRIDPGVGLYWLKRIGEPVVAGHPLAELHHRDGHGLAEAEAHLAAAIAFDTGRTAAPLVLRRFDS